ncbi:hypothetical protein D3C78_1632050 [compost metagenome]
MRRVLGGGVDPLAIDLAARRRAELVVKQRMAERRGEALEAFDAVGGKTAEQDRAIAFESLVDQRPDGGEVGLQRQLPEARGKAQRESRLHLQSWRREHAHVHGKTLQRRRIRPWPCAD